MKSLIIIISLFTASVILTSCGGDTKTMSVKTEIYCNDGCETCESCKPRVEKALLATEGIKSADMKVSDKTITVSYDAAKIDENKIKQIIALAGYDAGDVKADPAAYDNLDDCCKKK